MAEHETTINHDTDSEEILLELASSCQTRVWNAGGSLDLLKNYGEAVLLPLEEDFREWEFELPIRQPNFLDHFLIPVLEHLLSRVRRSRRPNGHKSVIEKKGI